MPEQNRWSGEQNSGAWNRSEDRYARDDDGRYAGSQGRNDRFGQSRSYDPYSARADNRPIGDGVDRYGIPADYNFGGRGEHAGYNAGYDRSNPERYGQGGYGQEGYGPYRGQSPFGAERGGDYGRFDRDSGSERYQLGDNRRPGADRHWWDRTQDEVSSWFGDDEAARRRREDELRAGEHRGRGPKGYTRSDERIREDVNDRLTDHGHLDASDIETNVSSGEVTLSGTVHRREDKRRAEDIAEQILGVKHVQNNLRVKDGGQSAKSGAYGAATVGSTANQTAGSSQTKAN